MVAGATTLEELGPVQLRVMMGDDVGQQMNCLAERGLMHKQPHMPSVSGAAQLDSAARIHRTGSVGNAVNAINEPACGRMLF